MRALLLALLTLSAAAQNREAVLAEFDELLRIPNTAASPQDLRRNADWIRAALEKRGAAARLLEVPNAVPAVFGELRTPGAKQTVLFYAHYDGQPVDPSKWQGSAPFEPSLRGASPTDPEARLYARAAADDKAPILAMLAALDRLRRAGRTPSVNLKFLFEGEEESGSKNLGRILAAHRETVASDFWLICDGPVHQSRRMQLYFGARGVTGFDLAVYGPRRELHSGHYGNWAPNPAMTLARLLASMKDDEGRVTIQGFYDGVAPLSPSELAALNSEPPVDEALLREFWLHRPEASPRRLIEAINQPSLNIRGLSAGATGSAAANVVPARAEASIDIRLVKGIAPLAIVEKVKDHIRAQGFFLAENREPTAAERLAHPRVASIHAKEGGYRAVRTSTDLPASRQVIATLEALHGPIVKMPTLGGSVPLAIIEDVVHVPLIGVPIVNHDNNQHSHNENLRIQNLWDGIRTMEALFTMRPPRGPATEPLATAPKSAGGWASASAVYTEETRRGRMYQPPAFREDRLEVLQTLIRSHPLATLITAGPGGLQANLIPFALIEAGGKGTLRAHLAKANPQLEALKAGADTLVVFHGPQAYITPSWSPSKREHGRVLPTWNYVVVQVRGTPRVIEDPAWLRAQIEALTHSQESPRPEPWHVSDAPEPYVTTQLAAIAGIEIPILSIEGKWKMSQNRPAADRRGIRDGLRAEGVSPAAARLVDPD